MTTNSIDPGKKQEPNALDRELRKELDKAKLERLYYEKASFAASIRIHRASGPGEELQPCEIGMAGREWAEVTVEGLALIENGGRYLVRDDGSVLIVGSSVIGIEFPKGVRATA